MLRGACFQTLALAPRTILKGLLSDEKASRSKLSGNEIYCTSSLMSLVKNMLSRKLRSGKSYVSFAGKTSYCTNAYFLENEGISMVKIVATE